MKGYFRFISAALVIFILLTSFAAPRTLTDNRELILQLMMQTLKSQHYDAVTINDDYSEKVYELYVKRLDFGKRYFTKSDIQQLQKYTTKIDDEINNSSFVFYDEAMGILKSRLTLVKSFYKDILGSSFDFSTSETIETDEDKVEYALNEAEIRQKWYKLFKYETMTRLSAMMEEQEKALEKKDTAYKEKTFTEMEKTARERTLKSYDDYFKRMDRLVEDDWFSLYLNSIAGAFDPHTEYYPPKDKENFDIQISGRLEGIGATLQEKDDYIKVVRIVPGSASWKQGELKAGDVILKVAQGDEDPVDIVGMRLDDAVQLIRGKKGSVVKLTIKKMDGTVKVIAITRDVVIIEESLVKSAIIEDTKSGLRIGYIKLPQFYTDFTKTGGKGCAEDVKQELLKLKSENVKGIVFDLRDNGGGSLQDAVDIAGFFIPRGPIVQVRSRYGSPLVLEDTDPSVIYGGPLVVMVNTLSASASEIFAAAMQDYKRAIIIGSNTTYGKGTVQRFYNLDDFAYNRNPNNESFGSLKLTIQKFYRINGATTQLKGVIPDVLLPYIYNYSKIGEVELDFPMPWNEIQPASYTTWSSSYSLETIRKNSDKRVAGNDVFNLIEANSKRLGEDESKSLITLKIDDYLAEMEKYKEESKKYENIEKVIESIKVFQLSEDVKTTKADTSAMARIKFWHEEITKDAYIYEAVNVVGDIK